jgi:hypothetical protein
MGYFISSVIGLRHPPVALHAMYYTRTVFLSTDTLIFTRSGILLKNTREVVPTFWFGAASEGF